MTRKMAALGLLAVTVLAAGAWAETPYEAEPVLKAADLVGPEILRGPRYTVDSRVPVKGFLYRFAIRSDFGTLDAHGIHMLQIRVREIYALGQLEDMSKTKEFAEAAGNAIARPVTSTVNMLVNPVETITGLPDGVGRLFDRIELGSEKVYQAATAPGASGGEQVADVSKRVGGIAVTALGYEKERRDLAKGLGVDPYTTNPVLAKKLDDMAWVAFSGRFGIQAATSVVMPYSTVMSAATITNSTVYETPAADLINKAKVTFVATGASDAAVTALMKNPQYSLSVLAALAQGCQRLQGVNGVASVVGFAAIARTQDETRGVTAAVNMLARHHETVEPITLVSAPGPIIGRTAGGKLVLPAPVDYIAWTERAARIVEREDLKAPRRSAWLSGRMSHLAAREFRARGWSVDESHSIGAER